MEKKNFDIEEKIVLRDAVLFATIFSCHFDLHIILFLTE